MFSILQLNIRVTKKHLDGLDDPRSMTLAGLRRRGVTSTAINTFVRGIGITRRLSFVILFLSRIINIYVCAVVFIGG